MPGWHLFECQWSDEWRRLSSVPAGILLEYWREQLHSVWGWHLFAEQRLFWMCRVFGRHVCIEPRIEQLHAVSSRKLRGQFGME